MIIHSTYLSSTYDPSLQLLHNIRGKSAFDQTIDTVLYLESFLLWWSVHQASGDGGPAAVSHTGMAPCLGQQVEMVHWSLHILYQVVNSLTLAPHAIYNDEPLNIAGRRTEFVTNFTTFIVRLLMGLPSAHAHFLPAWNR